MSFGESLIEDETSDAEVLPPPVLGSVLAAADELWAYSDTDQMLRRAVELARERIGLERVGLFVRDPRAKQLLLRGTWGTGANGETVDEHFLEHECAQIEGQMYCNMQLAGALWQHRENWMLRCPEGVDGKTELGRGWLAVTPLVAARDLIGVMYNDTALSHAVLDERKQLAMAVFCSLLAGMVLPRRNHFRWPASACAQHSQWVKCVLRTLEENPRSSSKSLARQHSISAGHLARSFKADVGISLVEYRNRLLMDRFLVAMERGDGNLLAAALEAGFGSYTQFHRVYKRMFGTSPRERRGTPLLSPLRGAKSMGCGTSRLRRA